MKRKIENTLGQRIKLQRLKCDYTQEELALEMHIPKSTISAYENDKVDIKGSVLVEISKILETTPNYLLGVKEESDDFTNEAIFMLKSISDVKIREMLLAQIRAVATLDNN